MYCVFFSQLWCGEEHEIVMAKLKVETFIDEACSYFAGKSS